MLLTSRFPSTIPPHKAFGCTNIPHVAADHSHSLLLSPLLLRVPRRPRGNASAPLASANAAPDQYVELPKICFFLEGPCEFYLKAC